MTDSVRIMAIDWSGRKRGEKRRIWFAEVTDGKITLLECGKNRVEITDFLVQSAASTPNTIVGLDFAFSLPRWFLNEHGITAFQQVWELVSQRGEEWLASCAYPFWGRKNKPKPTIPVEYRETEIECANSTGVSPKSIFQINGAGSVGTASLRGIPFLSNLSSANFAVWPFQLPQLPLVIEIYPRILTGAVIKSNQSARRTYLDNRYPDLDSKHRIAAEGSEDAFDALVSALVMHEHLRGINDLPPATGDMSQLEGSIWMPRPSATRSSRIG
jgi:hypothetical protein